MLPKIDWSDVIGEVIGGLIVAAIVAIIGWALVSPKFRLSLRRLSGKTISAIKWLANQWRYLVIVTLLIPIDVALCLVYAGWWIIALSIAHLVLVMLAILLLFAPKRPLTTRVVDPIMHRGDYRTITEAIEAANPRDRILVRPGSYNEGLVMDKRLEIIGDGDPGDVVVQATGKSTLLFQTTKGCVANLTLQQMSGGEWHCVDIAQGHLELKGCDITSQSRACVAIHGGADPHLRCNRIHNGEFSGVHIYDNGQGTLEDNDIFGNARSGVKICEGSNPTLRHNHIYDNNEGVYIYDNGQGTLEDNDIFRNNAAGVEIATGGRPTLRHNRVNENSVAIYVREGGAGTIEDNDLRDNVKGAWDVSPDSEPNIQRARNQE